MTHQRLLYLDTQHLAAYCWQGGQLRAEDVFPVDSEGWEDFTHYLARHPDTPYSLLVNITEEACVLETIPFLGRSDRQALIARKTRQHFPETAFSLAVSLGHATRQRKNEKLLLSALTQPQNLAPWLQRLGNADLPLAGIYSITQLSGPLLKRLGIHPERCLLLCVQGNAIRESFLNNGHSVFSRLIPIAEPDTSDLANRLASEATKLQQYLIAQRLMGRETALPILIIAHPSAIPGIERACQDHALAEVSIIDNHAAARLLHLPTPPDNSRSETLFLAQLARSAPHQQFADDTLRHAFNRNRIRRGLMGLSFIALLAGALYAATKAGAITDLEKDIEALSRNTAWLEQRHQELAASFPQPGIDPPTLHHLIKRQQELRHQQRRPDQAYRQLGRVFNLFPDIQIAGITWTNGSDNTETIVLSASLPTTETSPDTFAALLGQLRAEPGNTVSVKQAPPAFERDNEAEHEAPQARSFSLQITRSLLP